MHDLAEVGSTVPAFLAKLWKLVNDPSTDHLIKWGSNGQSFIITNTVRFTQELLPMYYKHNNISSFIRQLNMYGFHKIVSCEGGGLKSERDLMEFSHTYFYKGHPYLLEHIKRKLPATRAPGPSLSYIQNIRQEGKDVTQAEILSQVLADVNSLKTKQANWDAKLASMKRENEALWRELAIFRQKHQKQEQIINKLIQFIVTMVRPASRNVPLRRRYPLMLNDSERATKVVSGHAGPTIRELDQVDLLFGESDSESEGQHYSLSARKPSAATIRVPTATRSRKPEEPTAEPLIQVVSPSTTYMVMSPSDSEQEPAVSPWIHVEGSDGEYDAAMTPIDPLSVNSPLSPPELAASETFKRPVIHVPGKSLISTNANTSSGGKIMINQPSTSRSVAAVRMKRSNSGGKKPRKNPQPQKKQKGVADSKTKEPNKDILAEALELIDDPDLQIPVLEKPLPAETENRMAAEEDNTKDDDSKILKLLEEVVAEPVASASHSKTTDLVNDGGFGSEDALTVAKPNTSFNTDDVARDLGNHVDMVQGDIDILKEFLKGDGYSLDANTLLELFNEDPMQLIMPPASESVQETKDAGNELISYSSPNLVDLMDMYASTPCMATSPPHSPSVLETPVMTPASPGFGSPAKKRRK